MDSSTIATLRAELERYTGKGLNSHSVLAVNDDGTTLSVISSAWIRGKRIVDSDIIVHLDNEFIVIGRDINDKPLVDALLQAGIPRERIILAYAGEAVPKGEPAPAG